MNPNLMPNSPTAPSSSPWHPSTDYDHLVALARRHLRELAGQLWTDHNSSDPGITLLEVLSFAIADLSYRTSFDIKDLLAAYQGTKTTPHDLATPDIALPNYPWTLQDLSKVLLDVPYPGFSPQAPRPLLRSVWPVVATAAEVPLYLAQAQDDTAYLTPQAAQARLAPPWTTPLPGKPLPPLALNGLYKLQVAFNEDTNETEEDHHLRDLNKNYFETTVSVEGDDYTLSVLLPYWDEIDWSMRTLDLSTAAFAFAQTNNNAPYFIAIDKLNYDEFFYDYYAEFMLGQFPLRAFVKIEERLKLLLPVDSVSNSASNDPLRAEVQWVDWHDLANGLRRNYDDVRRVEVSSVEDISLNAQEKVYALEMNVVADNTTYPILARVHLDPSISLSFDDIRSTLRLAFAHQRGISPAFERQIALEEEIYQALQQVVDTGQRRSIYPAYLEKLNRVFDLLYGTEGLWKTLGRYRNLCEDVIQFSATRIHEIALLGKVLVAPGHNPYQVLGDLYARIAAFLYPNIRFHTLSEMTAKGYAFDEIFNGPLLRHGFIDNAQLDEWQQRQGVIYTSDLVRIMMDVPGVEAAEDFSLSSYLDNRLMGRQVVNCLNLAYSDTYLPQLSLEKSQLQVLTNGVLMPLRADMLEQQFDAHMQQYVDAQMLENPLPALTPPTGIDRQTARYASIQEDLPLVYGTSTFGLPAEASRERQAQARQLKAYLLPFEQLLANYLQQIAHLPELFSFNKNVDRTYHFTPLYDVPGVAPLLKPFVEDQVLWQEFKDNLDNAYYTTLKDNESHVTFLERRNRLLDHLLGRFAETFQAYATAQLDRHKEILNNTDMDIEQAAQIYEDKRQEVLDTLISDKVAFAEDYPLVTTRRAQAMDYTLSGIWESDNDGGYKRRLCRLLGIRATGHKCLFEVLTPTSDLPDTDLEGLHIVEHLLLRPQSPDDLLLQLPTPLLEEPDKDPYSFRITVVLPAQAGRFRQESFRRFTEQLIRQETPAQIAVHFLWLNTDCGKDFESRYSTWLNALHEQAPGLRTMTTAPQSATIAPARNDLVAFLNAPCTFTLQAYDRQGRYMPAPDQTIRYATEDAVDLFQVQVSALGGILYIEREAGGNFQELLASLPLTSHTVPIVALLPAQTPPFTGLAQHWGPGEYRLRYVLNGQEALLNVYVSEVAPDPLVIEVIDSQGNAIPADQAAEMTIIPAEEAGDYALRVSAWGGKLHLQTSNEPIVLAQSLQAPYSLDMLYDRYGEGPHKLTYKHEGESQTIIVLIQETDNQAGQGADFSDTAQGNSVQAVDGVHTLVYDYQQPDRGYQLRFAKTPGELQLYEGQERVSSQTLEGPITWKATDLPSNDYRLEYYPVNGQPVVAKLNVINLDPRFKITKVVQDTNTEQYVVYPKPFYSTGKTYIWNIDEAYVSNAQEPKLTFDFTSKQEFQLSLTVHLEDFEAQYEMVITESLLQAHGKTLNQAEEQVTPEQPTSATQTVQPTVKPVAPKKTTKLAPKKQATQPAAKKRTSKTKKTTPKQDDKTS